ncbi:hypothetical protein AWENTII_006360 [Aspergillus wentii]|nr:hypothetical protein MW887_003154 [Aspergillus wentii]
MAGRFDASKPDEHRIPKTFLLCTEETLMPHTLPAARDAARVLADEPLILKASPSRIVGSRIAELTREPDGTCDRKNPSTVFGQLQTEAASTTSDETRLILLSAELRWGCYLGLRSLAFLLQSC